MTQAPTLTEVEVLEAQIAQYESKIAQEMKVCASWSYNQVHEFERTTIAELKELKRKLVLAKRRVVKP